MTLENPFKRVLSGILPTAMTLSMIPPPLVEASSGEGATSEYANMASSPSVSGPKGVGTNDAYNQIVSYETSIKVSLYWAPRAESWGTEPIAERYTTYDWSPEKVIPVIDGMYLYEKDLPVYQNCETVESYLHGESVVPDYWASGSGLGYLTSKYGDTPSEAYQYVHKVGSSDAWGNQFTYATKNLISNKTLAYSTTYWYQEPEFWGIDGSVAQNHLARDGQIPEVFYELEEWRSRIYNMRCVNS